MKAHRSEFGNNFETNSELEFKRILACGSLIKRKEKSNVLYNWLQRAFYINCKFKLILKWITMTPAPPSTTLRLLELLLVPLNLKGTSCFIQEHFLFQSCHDDARQWLANERWHSDSQEEEMEWRFMQSRRERNAIKRCQAFTPPFDELASCERLHYSILSAIRPGLKSVRLLLSSTRSPASIFLGSHRLVFHSVPTPLPGSHNSETKKKKCCLSDVQPVPDGEESSTAVVSWIWRGETAACKHKVQHISGTFLPFFPRLQPVAWSPRP